MSGTPPSDLRITYGMLETRHDLSPVKRQRRDFNRGVIVEELVHVIDRKISETWIEDGKLMGRWYWESGL